MSKIYDSRVYESSEDFVREHSAQELHEATYVRGLKNRFGPVSDKAFWSLPDAERQRHFMENGVFDDSKQFEPLIHGRFIKGIELHSISMEKHSYPEGDHYITEEYMEALAKAMDAERWEEARESVERLAEAARQTSDNMAEEVIAGTFDLPSEEQVDPAELASCEDLIEQQLDAWYQATPEEQRNHGITIGPLTDDEVVLDELVERYNGWKTEIVHGNCMHFYPK